MTSYTVTATREAGWWSLVARNVGNREVASQTRRHDQADRAIREAIALVLDVDGQSFDLEIVPELIGVTPSRVSQIEHESPMARPAG